MMNIAELLISNHRESIAPNNRNATAMRNGGLYISWWSDDRQSQQRSNECLRRKQLQFLLCQMRVCRRNHPLRSCQRYTWIHICVCLAEYSREGLENKLMMTLVIPAPCPQFLDVSRHRPATCWINISRSVIALEPLSLLSRQQHGKRQT